MKRHTAADEASRLEMATRAFRKRKPGAELIAIRPSTFAPEQFVVFAKVPGSYQMFVVWRMSDDGECFWGNYCERYGVAMDIFKRRA